MIFSIFLIFIIRNNFQKLNETVPNLLLTLYYLFYIFHHLLHIFIKYKNSKHLTFSLPFSFRSFPTEGKYVRN